MNVLLVASYFHPNVGGLEEYVKRLGQSLASRPGTTVTVLTVRWPAGLEATETYGDVQVRRVPARWRVSNTPLSPAWPVSLRRVIREISPDVVVVNVPVPGLANVVASVCGALPLVVVLHAATTLKAGHPAFNLLARCYEATAGARLLARADRIVAVSPYVRDTLPGRWQAKTLVVNNAVPVQPLEASARGPRRFVFLGQLNRTHAWKGLDQVLAACAQCRTSDAPVELVVGGDGDDLGRYREVADRLGLGRVSFRGWIGAEERRSLLASATATIVYPTTSNDALPTVILESWEAGTPVVASRIGALPTIVKDSSDGLLVEPGNPGALAETLMRVAGDARLAAELGAAGRRRVLAEFDWAAQVEKMEDILHSLTGGCPVRAAVPAL